MGNSLFSQIYRFHIFNCDDGGFGWFFFFAKKLTFQGLYNCKLKNEMTLTLEFFSRKKKKKKKKKKNNQSWQDGLGRLASLVQSFGLTRFSLPG